MTKILAVYEGNWADEMDVHGFSIFPSQEAWDKFVNSLPEKGKFENHIGSNQEIEYSGRADFLHDVTVTELTDEEADLIKRAFHITYGGNWGKFPEFYFDDEEDED